MWSLLKAPYNKELPKPISHIRGLNCVSFDFFPSGMEKANRTEVSVPGVCYVPVSWQPVRRAADVGGEARLLPGGTLKAQRSFKDG